MYLRQTGTCQHHIGNELDLQPAHSLEVVARLKKKKKKKIQYIGSFLSLPINVRAAMGAVRRMEGGGGTVEAC